MNDDDDDALVQEMRANEDDVILSRNTITMNTQKLYAVPLIAKTTLESRWRWVN